MAKSGRKSSKKARDQQEITRLTTPLTARQRDLLHCYCLHYLSYLQFVATVGGKYDGSPSMYQVAQILGISWESTRALAHALVRKGYLVTTGEAYDKGRYRLTSKGTAYARFMRDSLDRKKLLAAMETMKFQVKSILRTGSAKKPAKKPAEKPTKKSKTTKPQPQPQKPQKEDENENDE